MKYLRPLCFLLTTLCTISLLFGCGQSTDSSSDNVVSGDRQEGTSSVTFTDDLGREVTVEDPVRVAALLGSYADIWMLAGGTVCATADDAWDDLQLDLPSDCVNLGATKDLDPELLFASDPDFILASSNTKQHVEWEQTFADAGIPVAYFSVSDYDSYLHMLDICTQLTGEASNYETYGTALSPAIEAARAAAENRISEVGETSVLVLRASASFIRVKNSSDNVLGEILKDLGEINIADSDENLLEEISMESILRADPDRIFIVQSGNDTEGTTACLETFFKENPAWSDLTAVKSNRVYYVDKMLYNFKPNARWGEAYETLEQILEN